MNARSIVPCMALWIGIAASVSAQVPPPPAPPESESDFVKDATQLFTDLNAHQEKIEKAEVDEETLRLQEEILKTWDRLLDSAKKPPPSKQQSSDQTQNANQSPQQNQNSQANPQPQQGEQAAQQPMEGRQPGDQSGEQPAQQEDEQQPDGNADAPGQTTGQQSDQPADRADAEVRLRQQNRLAQLRQEERERLMKEVWGKLPQRIRQKLLNASDEKYLPEYEDRIQEYFRKLSEPESRSRTE